MLKKIAALILSAAMTIGMTPAFAANEKLISPASEKAAHWSAESADKLISDGIIEKDGELFKMTEAPDEQATRAQAVVLIVRAVGEDKTEENKQDKQPVEEQVLPELSDISGHWAEEYIKKAVKLGYVGGYPDGTFRPDNKITRAEIAKITAIAMKLESKDGQANPFNDLSEKNWEYQYVMACYDNGYIKGYSDGSFRPAANITCGEDIAITERACSSSATDKAADKDEQAKQTDKATGGTGSAGGSSSGSSSKGGSSSGGASTGGSAAGNSSTGGSSNDAGKQKDENPSDNKSEDKSNSGTSEDNKDVQDKAGENESKDDPNNVRQLESSENSDDNGKDKKYIRGTDEWKANQELLWNEVKDGFAGGDGSEQDPFLISSDENLAYLAQVTDNKERDTYQKYFKLTDDVTFNCEKAINENRAVPFDGTFDGNNQKISLSGNKNGSKSLFEVIGEYGVVNNLIVDGKIRNTDGFAGGIAVKNNGKIINCITDVDLYGWISGGICAINEKGSILNCFIAGSNNGSDSSRGGICGTNGGIIDNCLIVTEMQCGRMQVPVYSSEYGVFSWEIDDSNDYEWGGFVAGSNSGKITNVYYPDEYELEENRRAFSGDNTVMNLADNNICYYTIKGKTSNGENVFGKLNDIAMANGYCKWRRLDDLQNYLPCILNLNDTVSVAPQRKYTINNTEQLFAFVKYLNDGNTFEGKIIELTCDIELNDTSDWNEWSNDHAPENTWSVIDNFNGIFDGKGHTISGMYVKAEDQGMFGTLGQKAVVKNLKIEESYISSGKLAAVNNGKITDCTYLGEQVTD